MTSGALFLLGVTVDRNIVCLFMATAISCLQFATMLYGGKLVAFNLAASGAYVVWAIVGLFPAHDGQRSDLHWPRQSRQPNEFTVLELAERIVALTDSRSKDHPPSAAQ